MLTRSPAVWEGARVRAFIGAGYVNAVVPVLSQAVKEIVTIQYQWKYYERASGRRVQKFLYTVSDAVRRGVSVRVLLNREVPKHHLTKLNERTAKELRRVGADVRFGRVGVADHAKVWVVDREVLVVSSHNLSTRSVSTNTEVGVIVWHRECALDVLSYFERLWKRAGGQ